MDLNFINNVIFPNWIEKYEKETIDHIKYIAQGQGRMLKKYSNPKFILQRSIEISKSSSYKDFDNIQRLIFISNAMFTEDDEFIAFMHNYGWTSDKIKKLNTLLSKIKLFKMKNLNINFDISLLEEIKKITKVGFGINNPAIVINRLNELSVTKKDEIEHVKRKKY